MYCSGKDYLDKFDPSVYLQRYDPRAQHQLRCSYDAFRAFPNNLKVLVDYGLGPSLLAAMVAATKASEIVLSDYSPNNRSFLRKWLNSDPRAFDWTPHFNFFVSFRKLEGKEEEAVAESEEQLRAAVVHCAGPPNTGPTLRRRD